MGNGWDLVWREGYNARKERVLAGRDPHRVEIAGFRQA